MGIGTNIKQRRLQKDLTQAKLSKLLNVSRSTVANWEIERNAPDITMLIALSNILEIPLDKLVNGETSQPSHTKRTEHIKRNAQFLFFSLVLCLLFVLFFHWTSTWCISDASQIHSVVLTDSTIEIDLNLPRYCSAKNYFIGSGSQNGSMEISVGIPLDLTLKNKSHLSIPKSELDVPLNEIVFVSHSNKVLNVPLSTS